MKGQGKDRRSAPRARGQRVGERGLCRGSVGQAFLPAGGATFLSPVRGAGAGLGGGGAGQEWPGTGRQECLPYGAGRGWEDNGMGTRELPTRIGLSPWRGHAVGSGVGQTGKIGLRVAVGRPERGHSCPLRGAAPHRADKNVRAPVLAGAAPWPGGDGLGQVGASGLRRDKRQTPRVFTKKRKNFCGGRSGGGGERTAQPCLFTSTTNGRRAADAATKGDETERRRIGETEKNRRGRRELSGIVVRRDTNLPTRNPSFSR